MNVLRMRSSAAFWRVLSRMDLSITSTADGLWRRITGAADSDSSRSAKPITITALAFGSGTRRSFASSTTPERAFGADHDLGEIDRLRGIDELVQVVAADAPQDLRIAAVDFAGMFGGEAAAPCGSTRLRAYRPWELRCAAISRKCTMLPSESSDRLLQHVIDGLAVQHAARAAGIVGHHAADGGAAGGGNIRREAQAQRRELRVQLIEHDARLDARPALLRVHFEHAVVIFRGIDLNAFADRLPGLRRAAAAHGDGTAEAPADLDDADDILARLRNHDAQRPDLIDAGVGRIERARDRVEADFAFDLRASSSRCKSARRRSRGSNCTRLTNALQMQHDRE